MISHAVSRALLTKVSSTMTARTFSSVTWSVSPSPMATDGMYQPLSSLQEALYPSDLGRPTEEALDPRSYGYRVVYPATVSMDASLYDDESEYLAGGVGVGQSMERFAQDATMAADSYYNASFRPEIVEEEAITTSMASLSPLEKAAVMEAHRDWDAQLLEDEIMRFVAVD